MYEKERERERERERVNTSERRNERERWKIRITKEFHERILVCAYPISILKNHNIGLAKLMRMILKI